MAFKKGNQVNKGRKLSTNHKEKIRMSMRGGNKTSFKKGHKVSEETLKKMRIATTGEKNPRWLGGLTPVVRRIRTLFLYRQWRSDILTRDNFRCVFCGSTKQLEVDHFPKSFISIVRKNKITTTGMAQVCSELWDINNGRTLCRFHHDKTKT